MKKDNNQANLEKEPSKSTSSSHEKEKQALLRKLGITEEVINKDQEFIAKEENKKSKVEEQKEESAKELDKDIGWKNPKELSLNLVYGAFMGFSDAIPGYSGGTTLSILGFYQKLIYHVKNIFKPEVKGTWWKYLLWFLPFLFTWVGLLLLMMYAVSKASDASKGIVFVFLFGSFSIFSIPLFIFSNKKILPSFITTKKGFKQFGKESGDTLNLILMIVGFLTLLTVALIVRFAFGGVSFLKDDTELFNPKEASNSVIFQYLGAGLLAGFCMLIPGISGGLMLYLCDTYRNVSKMVSSILDGIDGAGNYAPYLAILVLGGILGIIISVIFVNWASKKWQKSFYSLCLGLVAGSFISIFVSLSGADYETLSDGLTLGLSLGMIVIAALVNVGLFIGLNQMHIIDFPKLYIKTSKDKLKAAN